MSHIVQELQTMLYNMKKHLIIKKKSVKNIKNVFIVKNERYI